MRTECNSLNSHLFRKNIVADPSCKCRAFESTHHFFDCLRYAAARTRHIPNNLNAYTSHDFLFRIGKKKTQEENKVLFSQVQTLLRAVYTRELRLVTYYRLFKTFGNRPTCTCIWKRTCCGHTSHDLSLSRSRSGWYRHSSIYAVCSTMTQEMFFSSFGSLSNPAPYVCIFCCCWNLSIKYCLTILPGVP